MTNQLIVIISIAGSIASLFGAYLAFKAKRLAKSSAEIAVSARDSIIRRQDTTELADNLFEAKKVQQIFGKYSIAQNNRSLSGVDFGEDAGALQSYIFKFNENREIIENSSEIETQTVYDELNSLLNSFSGKRLMNEKKDVGKQIRLLIDDIIFKLRKVINQRNTEI